MSTTFLHYGTMASFWPVIKPLLEKRGPKRMIEIGIDTGLLTVPLCDFAQRTGAVVHAIDPQPRLSEELRVLLQTGPLTIHTKTSLEALPEIGNADVVFIDGDHNWYTVYHELTLLKEIAGRDNGSFPMVFLHDTGWPYGYRDMYYDPSRIPEEYRQPYKKGGLLPGIDAIQSKSGINAHVFHAEFEGGKRNGVLAAIEDFLRASEELSLCYQQLPGIHGLGIIAPSSLLRQRSGLAISLNNLRALPQLHEYIQTMENDRLSIKTLLDQAYAYSNTPAVDLFRQMEQRIAEAERIRYYQAYSIQVLRKQLAGERMNIARIHNSRSWRMTRFLRQGEERLRRLKHTLFSS